jgi:hypothetical protein
MNVEEKILHDVDINQLTQIGAGGILALFILKSVFDFIKNTKKQQNCYDFNELDSTLSRLSDNIDKQTEILRENATQNKINTEMLRRLIEDLRELRAGN